MFFAVVIRQRKTRFFDIHFLRSRPSGFDGGVGAGQPAPLEAIRDHNLKYLLTMDFNPNASHNGIRRINAFDWLLSEQGWQDITFYATIEISLLVTQVVIQWNSLVFGGFSCMFAYFKGFERFKACRCAFYIHSGPGISGQIELYQCLLIGG